MKKRYSPASALLLLLCAAALFPVCYMLLNAVAEPQGLYQVFVRQPFYLYKFWKSLALCAVVVLAHVVVSCMGGYAFAKFSFWGKRPLYFLLVVLMMLPVQATLVPCYLILDRLRLLDTWAALALPCIFSPFGTVLMTQVFRKVDDSILDAAKVDGAGLWRMQWQILAPAAKGGVVSLALLTFVDVWNMVEQPMVFLQAAEDYPLGVFLATLNETNTALSFAGGLLSMVPVLLLFLYCREDLTEGVALVD